MTHDMDSAQSEADADDSTLMPDAQNNLANTIKQAVEDATKALKVNRDRILDEKKKLATKLTDLQRMYQDIDPELAREAVEKLQELENENQQMVDDHQQTVGSLKKLSFENTVTIEALKAGVRPEALPDIINRASLAGWDVNEDGKFAQTGETKDSSASLNDWFKHLHQSAPHLYTLSAGGGAISSPATGAVISRESVIKHNLKDIADGKVIIG